MKAILAAVIVAVIALLLIGISLFELNDGTILTSPPEAVVENFTRALATHRYGQALKYLAEDFRKQTDADALKRLTLDLELRVGKIRDVRGEGAVIRNNDAEARAVLKTSHTKFHTAQFELSRQKGVWLIEAMQF